MITRQFVFKGTVDRVVDGDTYDIVCDLGFDIYYKIRVRLKGVDTPEVFGKNKSVEGVQASEYVKQLIQDRTVTIQTYKNAPSSFNRWEADVFYDSNYINEDGKAVKEIINLADHLVSLNLAKRV